VNVDEYLASAPLPDRTRWDHQVEGFARSHDRTGFYLSMEQRTGKTQVVLDTAGLNFLNRRINGLVIAAMPSGAPRNWLDEINALMLPAFIERRTLLWDPTKSGKTKKRDPNRPGRFKVKNLTHTELLKDLLTYEGLAIICINGESTNTPAFCDYMLNHFLVKRKTLLVGDEGTLLMKSPDAARTKSLHWMSKKAEMRRVLDGTPTGEGPFDLFAQYRFLSEHILGSNATAFRAEYSEQQVMQYGKNAKAFKQIKKDDQGQPIYRNLDKLQRLIAPHTYRVRFKEVFANVPDPIYQKRYVELTDEQRAAYEKLSTEYELELQHLGKVTVANVLTRYLRLQQLTSGFWPNAKAAEVCELCSGEGDGCAACDGLGVIETQIPLQRIVPVDRNPKLLGLAAEFKAAPQPAIIWCRFNQDIDDVLELSRQLGRRPVRYDGQVDDETKHRNKAAFQAGDADTFVAKTRSAGRAVNVSAAEWMMYYSSEFGLNQRLQSEVRAQTGLRTIATGIIDLIAAETKDEDIVRSHRARRKLSDLILNEHSGKWI
jgi:hypothetical protein